MTGKASTIDIINSINQKLPQIRAALPAAMKIEALSDQSVFVRAAISGVIREAAIAGALTGLLILLFLGSWRSTLIITISIPLSILASIACLSALGETINIMTLGGLALAVGILVDDATVTIENINYHLWCSPCWPPTSCPGRWCRRSRSSGSSGTMSSRSRAAMCSRASKSASSTASSACARAIAPCWYWP
jgi:hypothetical protein